MADLSNTEEQCELNISENEETSFDFVADIFDKVRDISTLVSKARLHAQEAEIRAMFSLQFAQRAIEEAKSAHLVSESLAKTSHVVAMLALEITNDTDYLLDDKSLEESLNHSDSGTQTQPQDGTEDDTDDGSIVDKLKLVNKETAPASKFDATFPHDLRTDDTKLGWFSTSHLPAVSEEMFDNLTTDDVKRRMMLYKDSKLMKLKADRRSMEKGDGADIVYENQATQTC